MILIREHFDLLFTTDCRYSRPIISGDSLRICVRDLGLMEGHPLRTTRGPNLVNLPNCHFVFEQVRSSVRNLTPYIGNPISGKFGPSYTEADGPFSNNADSREYGFEGRLDDPPAFVDWTVNARCFMLEVPGARQGIGRRRRR